MPGSVSDQPASPPPSAAGARTSSRWRWIAAAIAALIPLIPIAIGLGIGAGATPASAPAAPRPPFTPVGAAPHPRRAGPAGPTGPAGSGALVALVTHPTAMRGRPGGAVIAHVARRTPFGSPQAMWVQRVDGAWLGVVSVLAGNHRLGWIPASAVSLSRVGWSLHVSLAQRRLTVRLGARDVKRYTVAIGAPGSPTPTGRFAVTDRLLTGDPAGPYGCCILALSAVAPHFIQGWTGGNRIAIHSTPETSTIGDPVSHGCIRLTLAEGRWLIDHIPLGTPTIVSS